MKRSRILAVCVVALCAFGTTIVATAQAEPEKLEYGTCVKAPKVEKTYAGGYTDKNCQVVSGMNTGKYEWVPLAEKSSIATSTKSKTFTITSAVGTVVCKKGVGKGEITGATEGTEQITFVGCEVKGAATGECHSEGQSAGTMIFPGGPWKPKRWTITEEGELRWRIWGPLPPVNYICAGVVLLRFTGFSAGEITAGTVNVMSTKTVTEFKNAKEQLKWASFNTEYSIDGGITYEGPIPTAMLGTFSAKLAQKLELKEY